MRERTVPTCVIKTKVEIGRQGAGDQITWPLFHRIPGSKTGRTVPGTDRFSVSTQRRRQVSDLRKDMIAMAHARSAEPLVNQEQNGVISGVQSYGFFVEIPPSMVEGLVHVSSLNDDWYEYRSRQNRLVGRRSRRVYQLGDQVKVNVLKVDVLRNRSTWRWRSTTILRTNPRRPIPCLWPCQTHERPFRHRRQRRIGPAIS